MRQVGSRRRRYGPRIPIEGDYGATSPLGRRWSGCGPEVFPSNGNCLIRSLRFSWGSCRRSHLTGRNGSLEREGVGSYGRHLRGHHRRRCGRGPWGCWCRGRTGSDWARRHRRFRSQKGACSQNDQCTQVQYLGRGAAIRMTRIMATGFVIAHRLHPSN